MSSSRFTSLLFLIPFTLLLQIALGTNTYLFQFCSSSGNFAAHGPYESNLNKLTSYLYLTAPPTGFGFGSVGPSQFKANGLALCRGDINITDCQSCIAQAGSEIRQLCPNDKGAIIWYDECQLKYSNLDFFGKINNQEKFYMCNSRNVSDPIYLNKKTNELLRKLAEEASSMPKMYATGELEIAGPMKLYGLVQCTRDLSSIDCENVLMRLSVSFRAIVMEKKEGELWVGVVMCVMRFTLLLMPRENVSLIIR